MKKIFKIFLVFLIAINFVFSSSTKINAAENPNNNELRYYLLWKLYNSELQLNAQGNSPWIETNSDTAAWGITTGAGNAVYEFELYFDIPDVEKDETIELSFDLEVDGLYPNIWGVDYQVYIGNTGQWKPIYHPSDNAEGFHEEVIDGEGYVQKVNNYRYTNTTNNQYTQLKVVISMQDSRNITQLLVRVLNSKARVYPSDEKINIENNENIKGIFGTVKEIFNKVIELPQNIATSLHGFLSNIVTSVYNIGNQIANSLTTLGNFIIDGLKSLFIPSDTYFKNYFDSLYDFFSEKLGILIMPFDILISFMNNISNLGNGDGYIHIPNIEFMDINLIPKTDYNLKKDMQEVMGNYYDMYYLLTDVIIYFMMFNMAKRKFDEIVRGAN